MSTAKFDTLSNLAGSLSVPVATVAQGTARAWVNFNGTGTVAIRASFNVTSITDNGTGDYTVNFTNAMVDANYAVTFCFSDGASSAAGPAIRTNGGFDGALVDYTSSGFRIGNTAANFTLISVAIFR
jgi:hypothetical protein